MLQSSGAGCVRVSTRAKINLTLDILGRRADGYHDIDSVMQSIELGDELLLYDCGAVSAAAGQSCRPSVDLVATGYSVPTDDSNLAVRAARVVLHTFGLNRALKIRLHKRLPVAAGLAGGSSDAAGVVVGLNALYSLGLAESEMEALGQRLGSDVPFCIRCGTARAGGTGERLTQLPFLSDVSVIVLAPSVKVSTAEVYRACDNWPVSGIRRPDTGAIVRCICQGDIAGVASALENVFYPIVSSLHPIVEKMVQFLLREGAMGAMMSGSGPSVFGLVPDEDCAREMCQKAVRIFDGCFVAVTRPADSILVDRG
jgi:4-diphosphocytidyl-2-C-methyl-D-erythritol kinase